MVMYKAGMVVEKGLYWNPLDGQRVDMRKRGILPGDENKRFLKTSPAGLLVIAPLFGMMYVLFLPLFGIGAFLISCLTRTILVILAVAIPGVRVCSRIAGKEVSFHRRSSLLPAKYGPPARKASCRVSEAPHALTDSRILLVDDEMAYVDTIAQRLQSRGLKTDVVYDGEQALELVKDEEPDVMVLDLRMPGMDGMEVLRQIRQSHPGVQVIVLSGKGTERDKEEAGKLGIFDFLKKPIEINTLLGRIKEAYWTRLESPAARYARADE